jgi:hypothetical protein
MAAPAVRSAAAPAPPPPAASPTKSRRGLIIAAAAAVVIVGAVLAFALTRSSGTKPTAGSTTTTARGKTTTIGPKTVNVSGQVPWTDTGIVLQANDDVSITATGTVFPNTGNRALAATPDGVPNHPEVRQFNVVPNTDHSGLIGRVGDAGTPFVVGHAAHIHASTAGTLFLGINDVGLDNNDGAFAATITVTRK